MAGTLSFSAYRVRPEPSSPEVLWYNAGNGQLKHKEPQMNSPAPRLRAISLLLLFALLLLAGLVASPALAAIPTDSGATAVVPDAAAPAPHVNVAIQAGHWQESDLP